MSEEKKAVIEKRVNKTVIRRRRKKDAPVVEPEAPLAAQEPASEEPAAPVVEPEAPSVAPEEAASAPAVTEDAPAEPKPDPNAAAEQRLRQNLAQGNVSEDKSARKFTKPAGSEGEGEESESSSEVRPRKKGGKKPSRADFLMDEYARAGGLKQAAELARDDDGNAMGRIYEPVRQSRKRRVVGKREFKKTEVTVKSEHKRKVKINGAIQVAELAKAMSIAAPKLIKKLMELGSPASMNDVLDLDTATLVAGEFDHTVENVAFQEDNVLGLQDEANDDNFASATRPPVVTVMGHVDHGKTSLLDYIRKSKVAAREAGGITQHIGAYQVEQAGKKITFIDTPGHEAFTAMRARGAQVTDIVILVVAADDSVKPQTIEAINHAKAAQVPIIVAINKIDKADADIDKVKRDLTEQGLVPEDWGGDIITAPVSAHSGQGIDDLLEMILLQADVLELTAKPDKPAQGYVLEARVEKGKGVVATIIVTDGTLKKGDIMVAGLHGGRARALLDDTGAQLKEAPPATPLELLGLSGAPEAGDLVHVVENDEAMKQVVAHRDEQIKIEKAARSQASSLDDLFARMKDAEVTDLQIVLKTDVQGSLEAIRQTLDKLATEQVRVKLLHAGVGAITESDVRLASASGAVLVGFNVRPDNAARRIAESEGLKIQLFRVIYELSDVVKKAMQGLLDPTFSEEFVGRAEVREVFQVSKVGVIAGCAVIDGKIVRNSAARVLRDGTIVYEGKIDSLKRFKDDAREVAQGYECGIGVENFNDIKSGDVIEAFEMKQVEAVL